MVLAIVAMMLLGITDMYFVGKLGTAELAAVSFTLPIAHMGSSVALGVGMAISSLTSRLIGENRQADAARMITDGILLATLVAVIISAVGIALINPLFRWMGASERVLPLIHTYMFTWLCGAPMLMLSVISSSACRAIGDTRSSAQISITLSLINLVLDPLLIFGIGPFPRLEVRGAALATVIAAAITLLFAIRVLGFRERMLRFSLPPAAQLFNNWRELRSIAIPAIGANLMTPLAAAIMTAVIASQGAEAVAGFGVGTRIEAMSLILIFALSATLPMFIGQNIGAGRGDRAYRALTGCLRFSLLFQAGVYLLLLLTAAPIAGAFSSDPQVTGVIELFLRILPLTYGGHAVVILVMVSLNVLRRPRSALLLTVVRLAGLYLPLAYLGSRLGGVAGLFAGAACGNLIAGWVAYRMAMGVLRQQAIGPSLDENYSARP